jgi:hypothetical protein
LSNEDVRTIIMSTAQRLPDRDFPNWAGTGRIRMKQGLDFNLQEIPTGGLSPGCNMVTLTFATGTDAATLTSALSPPSALQAVWRLDNTSRSFQAFMPQAPQASDLTSLNLLDAAFICVDAAASISMPRAVSDPASAPISVSLPTGCSAVGLTFLDGTAPSGIAAAITPPGTFQALWRLDNATGSYQAYVATAPQASDLASLQFLDAVFICTSEPATLVMPAVALRG